MIDNEWISEYLRCPICKSPLQQTKRCENCDTVFPVSKELPVLIDFANSIFCKDDFKNTEETVFPRLQKGSFLGRMIRRLTFGKNNQAPQNVAEFLSRLSGKPKSRVLVIGGGSIGEGTEALYNSREVQLVGTDVYCSPNISLICDGHSLPFLDETFDGVVIQAVLEHVLDPRGVVEEIHRVLKAKGSVYAETPFMQQVHEAAYDFTRYTLSGHRWLFRDFKEVDAGVLLGPGISVLWSISYFVRSFGLSRRLASFCAAPFFWLRFIERFAKKGAAADAACGLYFLGEKSDRPLLPRDMPDYYKSHHN